ncbi:hypothetical protein SAR11G3_00573 [Candidatus Pelagibacter sp. IMCC9063]|nr:hypothetical protein SAR11G3_00573 [Candidatus Pelagibacter sp. IMCC9063]
MLKYLHKFLSSKNLELIENSFLWFFFIGLMVWCAYHLFQ